VSTGPDAAGTPAQAVWDAASAEALHPVAREALLAALDKGYADPRRLHGAGRSARLLLDNAREVVASCLGARPDEVSFTGSGTEAVHRGLLGLHRGRARDGRAVVRTAVEHSSVAHAVAWAGAPDVVVPVDREGRVAPQDVAAAVASAPEPVALVAVQSANHEVGTLQPVAAVADAVPGVPLFVAAGASAGRLPLPEGWAVAAASAHKWGGPPGVGVLLVRKGARWRNPFPADDRVDERVAGFENVPAALAAAAALSAVVEECDEVNPRHHALIDRIRGEVARLPDVEVVGDPVARLPHLLTFSCLYVDGEALVTELDRRGFGIASGSACTASTLTPSHVLAAMGVLTHGNVRLALPWPTEASPLEDTEAAVDRFLALLPEVLFELRGRVGL
jgi:cysteine desulfurase